MDLHKYNTQELIESFFKQTDDYSCIGIEDFLINLKVPTKLVKQNGVLLILITEGILEVNAGYKIHKANKEKIIIIQPNKPFSIINTSTKLDGIVLYIKGDGLIGTMGNHSIIFNLDFLETWSKSMYTLDKDICGFIENIFKRIAWEKNNNKNSLTIVNAYVITLLLELNNIYNELIGSNRAAVELSRKFKKEIYNTINKQLSISEYARQLSVTSNHLNKAIKSTTGVSASNLLSKIKLIEAKYLLMMSNITITEVAIKLGFEDTSYFSRYFKKHEELTPSEFRRRIDLS